MYWFPLVDTEAKHCLDFVSTSPATFFVNQFRALRLNSGAHFLLVVKCRLHGEGYWMMVISAEYRRNMPYVSVDFLNLNQCHIFPNLTLAVTGFLLCGRGELLHLKKELHNNSFKSSQCATSFSVLQFKTVVQQQLQINPGINNSLKTYPGNLLSCSTALWRADIDGVVSSEAGCLHVFQTTWNVFPHCLITFGESSFVVLFLGMRLEVIYEVAGAETGNTRATPRDYSLALLNTFYWQGHPEASSVCLVYHVI